MMRVKTKPELMQSMKHYQKLAAERLRKLSDLELKKVAIENTCAGLQIEITELKKEIIKLQIDSFMNEMPINPWQSQHGGSHYAELTIQPLQYTLGSLGYEAFKGACHNHVARYTTRKKDNEVAQLKKARHILDLWIYEAEQNEKK